ncbi:MAG: hypothetical protein GC187_01725 [Alphaproteobacteria bacterium]|nr:hypothetical protein [Alphaproteobacteria bacterium]
MAVISFHHRFVFIKTQKTAGTSIEIDLAACLGSDAVVTPVEPAVAGHAPRNHVQGARTLTAHASASQIREFIGAGAFAGMAVICVEREPVDKCLSHFHMKRNSPYHNPDGAYRSDWAQYCQEGAFPVDIARYAERDAQAGRWRRRADHVIAYERLNEDLPGLLAALGVEGFQLTSRAKSDYRTPVLVRPEDVTPAQRQRIYEAFAGSCALTGLYL